MALRCCFILVIILGYLRCYMTKEKSDMIIYNLVIFSIFAGANTIAYNARNVDGKTYIDGVLNETTIVDNLLGKKTIITIVNNSVDSEKTGRPSFFSTYNNLGYFANLAFYNSIGFDSVPTKETDGFTEQDLITWVIDNMINGTPQSGVFPYVFPLKVN